jgi:hypothetical protein
MGSEVAVLILSTARYTGLRPVDPPIVVEQTHSCGVGKNHAIP